MKRYNIICKNCKAVREVGIVKGAYQDIVDWLDNNPDPQLVKIVSARKRFDGQFGWECICGNNDMWTPQESRFVKNKANPEPKEIAQIMKDLKPVASKFEMVGV